MLLEGDVMISFIKNFTVKGIAILTVLLLLSNFLIIGRINFYIVIFCLLLFLFGWYLSKQLNKVDTHIQELKKTIKKIETEKTISEKCKREIEEIIDRVDDIAIFSLNKTNNQLYISKGAEQIYGYSHEELVNDPMLLKEAVYEEDREKVAEMEKNLQLGEPTQAEFRIIRANGRIGWIIQRETPVKSRDGSIAKIKGNIIDITTRKGLEEKFRRMAFYDDLTKLANRNLLELQLKKALARSKRHLHFLFIMFIDLDGFKKVNDTMGHDCGDHLLKEVANRLSNTVREEDLIARIGGDEFIIVIEESNKQEMIEIATRTLEKVSETYVIEDQAVNISPSIGISMYPNDGEDMESLVNNADKAMYYAKNQGKNNFQFYRSDLPEMTSKKVNVFEKIMNHFQSFTK